MAVAFDGVIARDFLLGLLGLLATALRADILAARAGAPFVGRIVVFRPLDDGAVFAVVARIAAPSVRRDFGRVVAPSVRRAVGRVAALSVPRAIRRLGFPSVARVAAGFADARVAAGFADARVGDEGGGEGRA